VLLPLLLSLLMPPEEDEEPESLEELDELEDDEDEPALSADLDSDLAPDLESPPEDSPLEPEDSALDEAGVPCFFLPSLP
jgi:hypothetical protein